MQDSLQPPFNPRMAFGIGQREQHLLQSATNGSGAKEKKKDFLIADNFTLKSLPFSSSVPINSYNQYSSHSQQMNLRGVYR